MHTVLGVLLICTFGLEDQLGKRGCSGFIKWGHIEDTLTFFSTVLFLATTLSGVKSELKYATGLTWADSH